MDLYENPKAPLEDRVQDLLSQMTLEEKTCQMATLYGSGRVLKDALPQDNWKTEVWKVIATDKVCLFMLFKFCIYLIRTKIVFYSFLWKN